MTDLCVCPSCGYDLKRAEPVEAGDWRFDPHDGLYWCGKRLRLTPGEGLIFGALMRAHGRTLTAIAIGNAAGGRADDASNVGAVMVCRIRAKLRDLNIPCPIRTSHGRGYRWETASC